DTIDNSHLFLPTISLTGTVNDASYAIWVNGVQGANNGDGTWSAANVPINSGGTAWFTVSAYPPGDSVTTNAIDPHLNPSDPNAQTTAAGVDKDSRIYIESYNGTHTDIWHSVAEANDSISYEDDYNRTDTVNWKDGGGGITSVDLNETLYHDGHTDTNNCQMTIRWLPLIYPYADGV